MPSPSFESRIRDVVVYARGAVVTRVARLDDLPEGPVEVVLPGITGRAEQGSFRARTSGRDVVSVRSRVVLPQASPPRSGLAQRLLGARHAVAGLESELAQLTSWRDALAAAEPRVDLTNRRGLPDPLARTQDLLAARRLLSRRRTDLQARIDALHEALAAARTQVAAVQLEASQAQSAARPGEGRPRREAVVGLGPGRAGTLELELEYAVTAARWWPAYAARFTAGATRVDWALDAFVAQASDEDWSGVRLSLVTGDLVRDARLPRLASLRLGRAQPPAPRAYRPVPQGLDALFAAHDAALAAQRPPLPDAPPPSPRGTGAPAARPSPPPPPASAGAPSPTSPRAAAKRAARAEAPGSPAPMEEDAEASTTTGGAMRASQAEREVAAPLPAAVEPSEGWLDFDLLAMGAAESRSQRGRLVRRQEPDPFDAGGALQRIERLAAPEHAVDPLAARGVFDHRYDARAALDVASDGLAHRVNLATYALATTPRLTVVPRTGAEVYRAAELASPDDQPLLAGPVDVYVDGAFATTSRLEAVDRGGRIRLPVGVEDRVRVARNARHREETEGLLGGTTVSSHEVSIELSSSLGYAVEVEVLERAPVSSDADLEVELTASRPQHEPYDQSDRGRPIRGGLRWRVALPAGGRAVVEWGYRLSLPAKAEVVGGNRRE